MDPRKLSAQELLRLCLDSKDEALWTEFVRRFQPLIAGVIMKRLFRYRRWVDRARVDDLVSETFIKLCKDDFKALRNFEFRHENALPAFLKVVAARVVEDDIRKDKVEEVELDPDLTPGPPDLIDQIDRRRRIQEIDQCLRELKNKANFARDYKIFWFYFRERFTAQAIAQLPEIRENVKTVESVLLRLVKWVRECMRRRKLKKV